MIINDDRMDPAGRISKGKLRDRNAEASDSDMSDEFDDLRQKGPKNPGRALTHRSQGVLGRGGPKSMGRTTNAKSIMHDRAQAGAKRKAASVHSGDR